MNYKYTHIISLILLAIANRAVADEHLFELDFEQLMEVEVISIAKKPQSVRQTAAAIQVISQEDIKRSGATTLPEVFRGVPGVQVARIDGNKWAISIRGFNSRFSNKLLVLIDGRSVYSPIFSGIYWNLQDMPLTTIERIEVVRGPGGTLWGENAVNGVINIITKHSESSQGTKLTLLSGTEDRIANLEFGGTLNNDLSYRTYVKLKQQDEYKDSSDHIYPAQDSRENSQAGFRLDQQQNWMLQGAITQGEYEDVATSYSLTPIPTSNVIKDINDFKTAHLLLRSTHQLGEGSEMQLQAYYNFEETSRFEAVRKVHTLDIDAQHVYQWGGDQSIVWGLGYRGIKDDLGANNFSSFSPDQQTTSLLSAFIQDEIQLSKSVRLTLGSKFSDNEYTGFEYQPSARILWEVNSQHSLWSALSRAVRTPSRSETSVNAIGDLIDDPRVPVPLIIIASGNPEQKSEDLLAFELGYRGVVSKKFSFDSALFYNKYDNLRSVEQLPVDFPIIPLSFDNRIQADSYGLEFLGKWNINSNVDLSMSYSYLKIDADLQSGGTDSNNVISYEVSSPRHQAAIQSSWKIQPELQLNNSIYYTDSIKDDKVDAYTRVDIGVSWRLVKEIELTLVGQNLLQSQHKEFTSISGDAFNTEVPRSIYLKLSTQF